MFWFPLTCDERLGRCATENCGGQPIFRFECDGVGSNYCSGCRVKIKDMEACDSCGLPVDKHADACSHCG